MALSIGDGVRERPKKKKMTPRRRLGRFVVGAVVVAATAAAVVTATPARDDGQSAVVRLTGAGCPAHSLVSFTTGGRAAALAVADADGRFDGEATLSPPEAALGAVTVSCGPNTFGVSVTHAVRGVLGASSSWPLSAASVAAGAAVVAAVLVSVVRRRRRLVMGAGDDDQRGPVVEATR